MTVHDMAFLGGLYGGGCFLFGYLAGRFGWLR